MGEESFSKAIFFISNLDKVYRYFTERTTFIFIPSGVNEVFKLMVTGLDDY